MRLSAALFWTSFTLLGIVLQRMVSGLDALAAGIPLLLSAERPGWAALFILVWIFLQEGLGSQSFGLVLAWYGCVVCLQLFGRWLFETRNLAYVALMGVVAAAPRLGLTLALAELGELSVDSARLLNECALQALFFPLAWVILDLAYPKPSAFGGQRA